MLQLPGGILAQKFGGKYILAVAIFLSAILLLITLWAIDVGGPYGLIVVRVLMGLCHGPLYPSLSAFFAAWIPIKERGRLSSIIYSGSSVIRRPSIFVAIFYSHLILSMIALGGGVFSTYVSGILLSHFDDWNIVFYFFGALAIIWCALFVSIL